LAYYTVFSFRFSVKRINDINKLNSKFVSFENENGIKRLLQKFSKTGPGFYSPSPLKGEGTAPISLLPLLTMTFARGSFNNLLTEPLAKCFLGEGAGGPCTKNSPSPPLKNTFARGLTENRKPKTVLMVILLKPQSLEDSLRYQTDYQHDPPPIPPGVNKVAALLIALINILSHLPGLA